MTNSIIGKKSDFRELTNFVAIPYPILYADEFSDLNIVAIRVYGLLHRAWQNSARSANGVWEDDLGLFCKYNYSTLLAKAQCSRPTLDKAIQQLEDHNLIVTSIDGRGVTKYYPVMRWREKEYTYPLTDDEIGRKVEERLGFAGISEMLDIKQRIALNELASALEREINFKRLSIRKLALVRMEDVEDFVYNLSDTRDKIGRSIKNYVRYLKKGVEGSRPFYGEGTAVKRTPENKYNIVVSSPEKKPYEEYVKEINDRMTFDESIMADIPPKGRQEALDFVIDVLAEMRFERSKKNNMIEVTDTISVTETELLSALCGKDVSKIVNNIYKAKPNNPKNYARTALANQALKNTQKSYAPIRENKAKSETSETNAVSSEELDEYTSEAFEVFGLNPEFATASQKKAMKVWLDNDVTKDDLYEIEEQINMYSVFANTGETVPFSYINACVLRFLQKGREKDKADDDIIMRRLLNQAKQANKE